MEVYDWLSNIDLPTHYKPFLIIEVKFKGGRKEFYNNHENVYLEIGELVVVEGASNGFDVGHVSLTGELVRVQLKHKKVNAEEVTKKVYRKAGEADVEKWKAAKALENEAMSKARKLALDLKLSMKISDVDYQGDGSKATFYYTAQGRVDFRELIKRMAETFRVRIEMRQIGMRQEAARLGGISSCGRELCCSTWLTNFKMVSTAAARYQNLSINTSKLAGQCGKLKCCLNFELDTYLDALKDIPEKVDVLQTEIGNARLQKTDIFKKMMWFSYQNQEDWIPLKVSRVREIVAMNKRGEKPNNLKDEAVELKPSVAAEKILDYENVVGQDSLTRLDNNQRRNKNNRRNDKNQAQGNKSNRTKPVQNASEKPQNTNTPSGDSESKPQQRNSRNRNRNRNKGRNPSADKKNEN
jgi:cell fate regulator YaaT (PSP1 superfamily)